MDGRIPPGCPDEDHNGVVRSFRREFFLALYGFRTVLSSILGTTVACGEHLSGCRDVQAGGEPERFSGNFGVRRRR